MPMHLELALGGILALLVPVYLMAALLTPRRYWPSDDVDGGGALKPRG
jgi:hypothetical protein